MKNIFQNSAIFTDYATTKNLAFIGFSNLDNFTCYHEKAYYCVTAIMKNMIAIIKDPKNVRLGRGRSTEGNHRPRGEHGRTRGPHGTPPPPPKEGRKEGRIG